MKKFEQIGVSKQIIFYITFTVLLVACLYYLKTIFAGVGTLVGVLKPVIYGMSFAFILNVLMCPIERKIFQPLADKYRIMAKVKRPLSIVVTFLLLGGILALVFLLVLPRLVESIISLGSFLPQYVDDFSKFVNKILELYGLSGLNWNDWATYASGMLAQIGTALKDLAPQVLKITVDVTGGFINFFFGLIFAFYILAQKENLVKKANGFMQAYLPEDVNNKIHYVVTVTNETFRNFIGGQCLDSLCLGTITFIVLSLIQMPYALVIAVTVGVTNMIPIIGPILGTIPCAFIILVISPIKAVILVITILILQEFESKLIYPRIVGGRVGLDGLWVLMAVLVGGGLGGLVGIILGVPLFAVAGKLLGADMERRIGHCPWDRKDGKDAKEPSRLKWPKKPKAEK